MEAGQNLKQTWVWLFALFIFFFNSFALPEGLTFTLLLTPLWFYIAYRQKMLWYNALIALPLGIYTVIHLLNGVDMKYYFTSLLMLEGLILFLFVSARYINDLEINWDRIFKDIAVFNFILVLCCIPLLFIPSLKPLTWYLIPISKNITDLPRLKLFTLEASHYSFLLAPIAIYFYSRFLFFKSKHALFTLLIVTVPLILSFSLGVLICLFFTGLLITVIYFKRIFSSVQKRKMLLMSIAAFIILSGIIVLLFPHNPLIVRMQNIFNGNDTSARGRTYEAFILAHKIVQTKSIYWGIGLGQLKVIGRDIIVQYYNYTNIPSVVRIPNASAETIVYFGYIGFAIRMLLQFFLFVKTKVYANPYRFWLFLFVFIYQFTGSYISNFAEYLIWIFAFSNVFPEFSKKPSSQLA
jgi:hypothetical protein